MDWGYDVSDYCAIDADLGTLDDLDELVAEAGRRDLHIVMDLVPNHSSDQHPWFQDSRSSRDAVHRDWYVWADGSPPGDPGGAVPNNWRSDFLNGPAWSFDAVTGQWYLHHFVAEQPDLNWWNEDLRDEFDRILRFWFDRGIAGFRIDVCHMIVKDKLLRDNPPSTSGWTTRPSASTPSGPSSTTCCGAGGAWPRSTTPPACCWARPTWPARPGWPASTARATSSSWPSTSRSSAHRSMPNRCASSWPTPRPRCRRAPGRCGPVPTTTTAAFPPAGHRTTLAGSASGSSCCSP